MLFDVYRRASNRQLNALLDIDRRSGQAAVHCEGSITEGPTRQKDPYGHLENPRAGFRSVADAVCGQQLASTRLPTDESGHHVYARRVRVGGRKMVDDGSTTRRIGFGRLRGSRACKCKRVAVRRIYSNIHAASERRALYDLHEITPNGVAEGTRLRERGNHRNPHRRK